ncbi:MAG: four-carbon acid sugar kinase family protein [Treponema sp.]|nr:four-carbon acid sugar kinase family protein [Treponema sp.]
MKNYLVIADDFTGSNDTGVQVRRRGIPVRVVFSSQGITGKESCVLDTESRALPEEDAFQRVLGEAGNIPFENFYRVIKKVDSTLRGNIGAETRALDQCYKPEMIVFAPAFPDLGRTTVNRIHCLNGVPVSQTELAKDPKTPVKTDDIQDIMTGAFPGEKVIHTGLEAVRSGAFSFDGGRIFCFDAASNSDLQIIVRTVLSTAKRVLWVGSAALADNLLNVEQSIPPALAVVASVSSVARNQIQYAEKQGVSLVKVPLYDILEKTVSPEDAAAQAIALLKEGKDVILLSSSTYSEDERQKNEESARRAGLSTEEMSDFTQRMIGRIAVMVLDGAVVSGLFLSGGDTAMSCFECAGALGSSIVTEIAVGIPLMRLIGGKHEGLKVVTKAGAFGREDAVFYALRKLREA